MSLPLLGGGYTQCHVTDISGTHRQGYYNSGDLYTSGVVIQWVQIFIILLTALSCTDIAMY